MLNNPTDNAMRIDTLAEKLADAETPGFWTSFTDDEAGQAGVFHDDALSEETAFAASFDNPDIAAELKTERGNQ